MILSHPQNFQFGSGYKQWSYICIIATKCLHARDVDVQLWTCKLFLLDYFPLSRPRGKLKIVLQSFSYFFEYRRLNVNMSELEFSTSLMTLLCSFRDWKIIFSLFQPFSVAIFPCQLCSPISISNNLNLS